MHNESNLEQFIVFKVANYFFALPIRDVLQVVSCPPQTSHELNELGVVQLGHHMIKVVDLHQQCNPGSFSQLLGSHLYLVIMQNLQGEFCGIPIYAPPDLLEFPLEKMRSLPQSEGQLGVLKIASHAAVLSWNEVSTTVFLLDMQRVLNVTSVDSYALSLEVSS
jgi:chemotaxis signal transduction protein